MKKLILYPILIMFLAVTAKSGESYGYSYSYSTDSETDLSPKEESFAEDLSYTLGQLEKNSRDYINYFSDYKNDVARELQSELIQTLINIKTKKYTINLQELQKDLNNLIKKSKASEEKIRSDKNERLLYRNISTLRQNLEMILEIVNEELLPISFDEKQTKKIKLYMVKDQNEDPEMVHYEHQLYKFSEQLRENLEKQIEVAKLTQEDKKDIEEAVKLATELKKVYSVELEKLVNTLTNETLMVFEKDGRFSYVVPRTIEVPDVPDAPEIPKIEVHVGELPELPSSTRFLTGVHGSRVFNDSLFVLSKDAPIYINNPTGNVKITGWDNDFVKANLTISVVAESDRATKSLLNEIKLSFESNNEKILIQPIIPSLTSSSRKIVSCQLNVNIPSENPVNCKSSYGEVDIRELQNVSTSISNSNVRIIDVSKSIMGMLSNSELLVSDCKGKIELKSNKGPVVIEDCSADISIDNNYGPIEISDCSGTLRIKNNSSINIYDYIGAVEIKNKNGLIKLSDIEGNLVVENAFKPLIVSGINGKVIASNKHATINIDNIRGDVTANNEASTITAKDLSGKIYINNESGKTSLFLNDEFDGPSQINSDYGIISLFVSEDSNIQLTTPLTGTNLKGNFRNLFVPKESSKNVFVIGSGKKQLDINGINTTVIISDNDN